VADARADHDQPIRARGPNDVPARLFAQRMGEILGQSVIVENVAGAAV
jgi:tripartite-type tricarboxylate transporter receptor subunit TctC